MLKCMLSVITTTTTTTRTPATVVSTLHSPPSAQPPLSPPPLTATTSLVLAYAPVWLRCVGHYLLIDCAGMRCIMRRTARNAARFWLVPLSKACTSTPSSARPLSVGLFSCPSVFLCVCLSVCVPGSTALAGNWLLINSAKPAGC